MMKITIKANELIEKIGEDKFEQMISEFKKEKFQVVRSGDKLQISGDIEKIRKIIEKYSK